jgi:iron complex transport system substrate-binding protein
MSTRRALAAVLAALACAGVAGAALAQAPARDPAPGAVQVTDDRGRVVKLPQPAQRIVSLLPSLTETVCALQACQRLVGVDRHSNWPASLRHLPRLGGLEDSQIERIAALKPDLVLVAVSARAVDRLEALGLPVLALEPANWAQTQQTIARLALVLGDAAAGTALVAGVQSRIDAAAARVPPALRGRTVYFEVASTPFAAGAASFVGELLARLGLRNIVPSAMGAFPQLNPEFVVRSQPALIMATAAGVAEMPARPGWRALRALQQHQTCGFAPGPHDTLMRPGPRLGDAAEAIVDCLVALPPQPPQPHPPALDSIKP